LKPDIRDANAYQDDVDQVLKELRRREVILGGDVPFPRKTPMHSAESGWLQRNSQVRILTTIYIDYNSI